MVHRRVSSQSKIIAVSYYFGFSLGVSQIFSYVSLLIKFWRSLLFVRAFEISFKVGPSLFGFYFYSSINTEVFADCGLKCSISAASDIFCSGKIKSNTSSKVETCGKSSGVVVDG